MTVHFTCKATTGKLIKTCPAPVTAPIYSGTYTITRSVPKPYCITSDQFSGVAGCEITRTDDGDTVTYRAAATDNAGNTRYRSVTIRRSPVVISGADYSGDSPVVRAGNRYTLLITSATRPSYVNAAPAPYQPSGNGGSFVKVGKNRWSYAITFTDDLRTRSLWNFGVDTGAKTHVVTVKVV